MAPIGLYLFAAVPYLTYPLSSRESDVDLADKLCNDGGCDGM
jgi:hypothetical protein